MYLYRSCFIYYIYVISMLYIYMLFIYYTVDNAINKRQIINEAIWKRMWQKVNFFYTEFSQINSKR